ncbi:hypothetical protein SLINC_0131 [Streptomyces lincolnensis]|uniref:Uncharacterized protein n=1 Tax=Streptomyces lincolnensis TaxID=1915 RepID=A0A1B1M165_STRLN|nr:hypothetical protein [Streptomyces lincolnensis]ANS62355.1 hypothetical protein SLINC_0131 [Streptomyces lincolnensis]AXG51283.1 hypothetical protein SLCG_0128 [Streptomyces lincolnensis]QMV04357.1 hypothetical protein GJU35_00795 [Streptomyces lincolnensis]QMV11966.1 hypothetical protein GJU35_44125 [Streptomyces lincolnensis]
MDAVIGHLAEDVERNKQTPKGEITLFDLPADTVKMLTWYIQHHPDSTASILGTICFEAHVRLELDPAQVGAVLRHSFHMDSGLGQDLINRLMDMALPPSARKR